MAHDKRNHTECWVRGLKVVCKKLNMSPKFYKIKQSLDIITGAEPLPPFLAVNNQMLTLWLLHQHPVNQKSLICFWREVPWSLGFLRDVRVCAECACLCTQLPRCVHTNNKSLKDTQREKWFVVLGYLEITKQDFSWQNMVCFLLCLGDFCCWEVVN